MKMHFDTLTGERERLVLTLASVLHRYGTPAHRMERVLGSISTAMGLQAAFFVVPTAVFAAFGPLGEQRTSLVRADPGGHDLGKVARLDAVVTALLGNRIDPATARTAVERIDGAPDTWPVWLVLFSFGLASAAVCVFFGGGWIEIGMAGVIGLLLGVLERIVGKSGAKFLYTPLAATLGAGLAHAGQALIGPYNADIVTFAGLLYLLPGLTLTTAVTELSTRHLVSGTARLMYAVLILIELAFGVALGSALGDAIITLPVTTPMPLPAFVEPIALVLTALSFTALFRTRRLDTPIIVFAAAVGFYGARLGALAVGSQLGAGVGALALAMVCNLYGRLFNRPPTVPLVPGILLLVPGSVGLRSMTRLLDNETLLAVDAAFDMTMVAISLAVGLLTANALVPPKRDL